MARIDIGRESGIIICHALGLDPNTVSKVDIHWHSGEAPYASVEMYLNEQVVYEIIQLQPVQPQTDE